MSGQTLESPSHFLSGMWANLQNREAHGKAQSIVYGELYWSFILGPATDFLCDQREII